MLREIRPDGSEKSHESLTFSEARDIIGGYVEHVVCLDGIDMLVNEDGHNLRLGANDKASTIYRFGTIVGTVIVGTRTEIARVLGA